MLPQYSWKYILRHFQNMISILIRPFEFTHTLCIHTHTYNNKVVIRKCRHRSMCYWSIQRPYLFGFILTTVYILFSSNQSNACIFLWLKLFLFRKKGCPLWLFINRIWWHENIWRMMIMIICYRSEVLSWLPASALFVGIIYSGSRALSRLVRYANSIWHAFLLMFHYKCQ